MSLQNLECSNAEGVSGAPTNDYYLTDSEVAARLRWSKKTLERKMREGVFKEGIHCFQRPGMAPAVEVECRSPLARERGRGSRG